MNFVRIHQSDLVIFYLIIFYLFQGFGLWLAKRLDTLGCVVFAGCLMEDGPGAGQLRASGSERMNVLQMDVTSQTHVDACVAKVQNVLKKQSFSGEWSKSPKTVETVDIGLRCFDIWLI